MLHKGYPGFWYIFWYLRMPIQLLKPHILSTRVFTEPFDHFSITRYTYVFDESYSTVLYRTVLYCSLPCLPNKKRWPNNFPSFHPSKADHKRCIFATRALKLECARGMIHIIN